MRYAKQRGFLSKSILSSLPNILLIAAVAAGVIYAFKEFRSLYIEKGANETALFYRDLKDTAEKRIRELEKELEQLSKAEADAMDKAVQEALEKRQQEVDEYTKTIEVYKTRNNELIAQLRRHTTDRPVTKTEPGSLSDIAVNSINRMIDHSNRGTQP